MGSLMAGWASPVLSAKTVSVERNRSLTKEEVENFWRLHKSPEDDLFNNNPKEEESEGRSSNSTYPASWLDKSKTFPEIDSHVDLEKVKVTGDWWTKSNWAFLNEPPERAVDDETLTKYVAQFHVAELASKKRKELKSTDSTIA